MLDANAYADPVGNLSPAERCLLPQHWTAPTPLDAAYAAPTGPASTAVFAVANHGRWVVECPDCHGAQLTAHEDPRFMCVECGNAAIGGKWRPVVWPKYPRDISALLDERPRHLANTEPGQTLKQVRKENQVLAEAVLLGGDA